jgi:glutathione S-transferase
MATNFTLILGSKNYSSWSLRAFLAMKQTGAPFDELVIRLDQPTTRAEILRVSPSGRVPALKDGELVVWDSLAVGEYLAEKFPSAGLWPADAAARAVARSVSAEMHSGCQALRQNMPMNIRRRAPGVGRAPGVEEDIARIFAIWRECRARFGAGGPFLFGRQTLADAMYAPVATRFVTYEVALDDAARAYVDALHALPAMKEWIEAARNEGHSSEKYDK